MDTALFPRPLSPMSFVMLHVNGRQPVLCEKLLNSKRKVTNEKVYPANSHFQANNRSPISYCHGIWLCVNSAHDRTTTP
jgi:hypothetical protein